MANALKALFVFIDGLGLGSDDPAANPLRDPRYPNLQNLLARATPIDACLGVDGLPQSATGQATLLTGINAAKAMGRHIEGFPPPALKKLVEEENLFIRLQRMGKTCTFANCYWGIDPAVIPLRRQSVTTVMALSALGRVRGNAELNAERAVTHDITRWTMHMRGYTGPLIAPETAANHLLAIAQEHDFTLFEYFLTDRAGHARDPALIAACLETLERFLPKVAEFGDAPDRLFLLSSDHGNIEDSTVATHTKNPVPLVAFGCHADRFTELGSLTDIAPAIINCFDAPHPDKKPAKESVV